MKVIIAGSRQVADYLLLLRVIDAANFDITEVVSGGARGVDALGERFAAEALLPVKRFPANWALYGRAAGPIRNAEMAQYADALIALWDGRSRGTAHMISQAHVRGLRIFVEYV